MPQEDLFEVNEQVLSMMIGLVTSLIALLASQVQNGTNSNQMATPEAEWVRAVSQTIGWTIIDKVIGKSANGAPNQLINDEPLVLGLPMSGKFSLLRPKLNCEFRTSRSTPVVLWPDFINS